MVWSPSLIGALDTGCSSHGFCFVRSAGKSRAPSARRLEATAAPHGSNPSRATLRRSDPSQRCAVHPPPLPRSAARTPPPTRAPPQRRRIALSAARRRDCDLNREWDFRMLVSEWDFRIHFIHTPQRISQPTSDFWTFFKKKGNFFVWISNWIQCAAANPLEVACTLSDLSPPLARVVGAVDS